MWNRRWVRPNFPTTIRSAPGHERGARTSWARRGGVFREGPVGLAHRRLSIVDPAGGTQPMANEGGDVIVVFNGEIYNHRSVRNELSNRHEFRSDADTEVILHAYEEYGLEMVTKLKGMFAFAIWDAKTERLVLARDPVGIKPLYVTTGPRPWFASELSALLEAGIDHGGSTEQPSGSTSPLDSFLRHGPYFGTFGRSPRAKCTS
ncbi:hypothetical protein ACFQL1_07285 [Halomicroarcula sp. GCM10025709]|uniref:hypothetical protein n=1 Tax=Halomicroarcula sp. GCM10025709 TaxID=3252669 RepID=UPI00361BE34F